MRAAKIDIRANSERRRLIKVISFNQVFLRRKNKPETIYKT